MRPYVYASAADVQALLAFVPTFTATSVPNATQVSEFITLASNDIDSVLALLDYDVPLPTSATASFEMLRSWTAVGAAYRAVRSMPQGGDSSHGKALSEDWKAILSGLEGGKRDLPDAGRRGSKMPRSADAAGDGSGDPIFTRGDARTLR